MGRTAAAAAAATAGVYVCLVLLASVVRAEDTPPLPVVSDVALQPLAAATKTLAEAMGHIGSPLPEATRAALEKAYGEPDQAAAVRQIQAALDPLCLLAVDINPESRVKVAAGPAKPELIEGGWRTFLMKVHNAAGVTAPLSVDSRQNGSLAGSSPDRINDRWVQIQLFTDRPLPGAKLSGLELEYRVVQLYSRDAGKRSAKFVVDVGQGTQDVGFRSELDVLFTALPSNDVTFHVKDEDGKPTTAGFEIRDELGRVYPSPAKRLAPDFSFHPQVYRADGETLKLPAGRYTVDVTRGPEYLPQTQTLDVKPGGNGASGASLDVSLKRWIDPTKFGYYSGDHHIHAAGCAHYANPTQGVLAKDMMRHVLGEDLKVGCNLTWGPCFDYQKQFFTGRDADVSKPPYILRYDVEVSGFGSHQSGHLVLLRLKNMMYPGGDSDKHWPTLGLNTLKWAKAQGAICGPAHSGNGIRNLDGKIPSHLVPPYHGIGACEFIVDVTHQVPGPDGALVPAVDFISTVDTEPANELSMWYHVLNCGFRTRASGETDFPCVTGQRVGMGRSYVKLANHSLTYDAWCEGIQRGRNYVSEGHSHILDMRLNDVEMGEGDKGNKGVREQGNKGAQGVSELHLSSSSSSGPPTARLTAKVAAYLPEKPEKLDPGAAFRRWDRPIPWNIEAARIPGTRTVKLEAIVNGHPVASRTIPADGSLQDVTFDGLKFDRSAWVALRIYPSSHTNPIFVLVDGRPIRASKRSAEWCLKGVDQCWKEKQPFYAPAEIDAARAAYDHARQAYRTILAESSAD
jgi:hypothetical protein